ncbi:hypothetical protein BDW75DRAFT_74574 [Aspergillus navahoensis]
MAGTGKSTISRTIADCLKKRNQLGASFFFKRGERDRSTAKMFFSTICVQLLLQIPALMSGVEKAINSDPYISEKWIREQFEKLILQPLLALDQTQPTTFIIVIDALDECEKKDDIRTILQLLPQVKESQSIRLRIFLTSRPEFAIRLGFERNKSYRDLVLHELPRPTIEHDIRIYLKEELINIRIDRSLPNDWPGVKELEELVQLAVPLFIFAATACRFVKEGAHPRKRLRRFLDFQETSSASQMDKIYLPVMNSLTRDEGNNLTEILEEFRNIVGVIVFLATPLSVMSLAQLLCIPSEDITQLLDPLHSVLSVPQGIETPVRILHLSFRDFLVNTTSAFHVDERETHKKIALHCLRVMNSRLKRNICGLSDYGILRDDISSQTLVHDLPADLQYSCQYWVHHLKLSRCCISEFPILSFLTTHLLHWLEALSLIGVLSDAVGIMDMLQAIVATTDPAVVAFLYDARRYILRNLSLASTTPLQLYRSGLVFSPVQSVVRNLYSKEIPNWIRPLPQVEVTWNSSLQTLTGHSDSVLSVAFSANGSILASGSYDRTIRLWDVWTGRELQTLAGHLGLVQLVVFSSSGITLASSSDDRAIRLWDIQTGKEMRILKGHLGLVLSMAFSPDGLTLASSSDDGTIRLWDTQTGKEVHILTGHSNQVLSLAFSANGLLSVSDLDDKTIKIQCYLWPSL